MQIFTVENNALGISIRSLAQSHDRPGRFDAAVNEKQRIAEGNLSPMARAGRPQRAGRVRRGRGRFWRGAQRRAAFA
ncbi:hypothetical protein, partial [Massilia glaciei]|uniref:hypothetical protein n=1 Tax=Massilia glaciei TaxID=1524097 RepID=UPI001C63726D